MKVNFTENWSNMQWTNVYYKRHPWWLTGLLEVDEDNVLFLDGYTINLKGVWGNREIKFTLTGEYS
ncbi:MAG: hypothetical protein EBS07_02425 [Sphingobacteriia bacterium]|nr:hypothetical protein [Sphingobacteriia bacterium]